MSRRAALLRCARTAAAVLLLLAGPQALAAEETQGDYWTHSSADGYLTLVDDEGNVITLTALVPGLGDVYIDEDNKLYEVTAIDGRQVRVSFREVVELPRVGAEAAAPTSGRWAAFVAGLKGRLGLADLAQGGQRGPIAIYHTHSSESYIPTSGTEAKDWGDIYKVGEALKEALERRGFEVIFADRANHNPHDGQAYHRSRATARKLLERQPVTVLDVHRDAIPAEQYLTQVNGQRMSKVRFVVGRQNPNAQANFEYAKRLKAVADEKFPGLAKGIFWARGNYNQDFGPRMILLEFGTHETSLEDARRAAELMADVIPAAAGMVPGTGGGAARQIGGAGFRTALVVVLAAAVAVVGYLWFNTGSWSGVVGALRRFTRREFAGKIGTGGNPDEGTGPTGSEGGPDGRPPES